MSASALIHHHTAIPVSGGIYPSLVVLGILLAGGISTQVEQVAGFMDEVLRYRLVQRDRLIICNISIIVEPNPFIENIAIPPINDRCIKV